MFDCLDFVFLDGDANLLPWKTEKFSLLYRMCKSTNKCFFSAGVGMMMLVYYCASGYTDLHVINGNGRGSHLTEIHYIDQWRVNTLTKNEVFLDNATGDYYNYWKDLEVWAPAGNIGLHYSKAAEAYGGIGEYMTKTKTYKTKPLNPFQEIYISKLSERKAIIKK